MLKDPVKKLTQKERENINDKKRISKEKKDKRKKKKSDTFDDEFDEDVSGESDDEMCVDKEMMSSQLSQDNQIFSTAELAAIEVNSDASYSCVIDKLRHIFIMHN